VAGDFLETVGQAPVPPDLIFYDMFSSETHGEQWTIEIFRRLFDACANARERAFHLHTLNCRPRGLLAAGSLSQGPSAGVKEETTIALTPAALATPSARRYELLAAEWIGRWDRSQAKFPSEVPADQRPAFAELIRRHRQFR